MRHLKLSTTLAALTLGATAASAQTPAPDSWIVTVKANGVVGPAYPGSKDFGVIAYPSFSLRRASTPATFSAPDDNISFALFDQGWIKAGPSGRFIGQRKAADHRELTGIHDVDWTLEGGAFLEVWPMQNLRARVDLRHAFNGHNGLVGDLALDFVQPLGAWTVSVGPRASFGDASYARAYYGVTAAEALANGRVTAFNPSGGITSVGVTAAASYTFSPQWTATGYVRYDNLVGSAGRSPIVKTLGTESQFTFGLKLAYSFTTSGF